MKCKESEDLLIDYIDNNISLFKRIHLFIHLRKCSQCRKELDELRRVLTVYRSNPLCKPEKSFWEDLKKDITETISLMGGDATKIYVPEPEPEFSKKIYLPPKWAYGIVISFIIMIIILPFLIFHNTRSYKQQYYNMATTDDIIWEIGDMLPLEEFLDEIGLSGQLSLNIEEDVVDLWDDSPFELIDTLSKEELSLLIKLMEEKEKNYFNLSKFG